MGGKREGGWGESDFLNLSKSIVHAFVYVGTGDERVEK